MRRGITEMKIVVTQGDIENAKLIRGKRDVFVCQSCPIAQSLKRKAVSFYSVNNHFVSFPEMKRGLLPWRAQAFTYLFDRREYDKIKPFSFTLDVRRIR